MIMAGKRGHGEGTIYKRSDGRWLAQMMLADGKRKSFYGKTRAEAVAKLTDALRDMRKGLPITGERQTLAQHLAVWIETIKMQRKPKTYRSYEQLMRLHVVPTLGKVRLASLTPQQVQQLYARKLEAGLSQTTVQHIHAVLHAALDNALRQGLVQRNVADLVDAPAMRHREMLVFNVEQAKTLLAAAAGTRLEALYVLALTTGMREGELLALRWRDVDLDAGHILVQHTLQQIPGRPPEITSAKTRQSRRKIALTSTAIEALRRHRALQVEEQLRVGPAWSDWDLVFCNTVGNPLDGGKVLYRGLRPLLKQAWLPAIRFHDLRHTAATLMLLQGVHPKIVSEMLGHANISITLQRYSHVLPDMQKEATMAMDKLLRS